MTCPDFGSEKEHLTVVYCKIRWKVPLDLLQFSLYRVRESVDKNFTFTVKIQ